MKTQETVSEYTEEYRYWKSTGCSHVEAKNKAIDEYRKHTMIETCPVCDGSGKNILETEIYRCYECSGSGKVRSRRFICKVESDEKNQREVFGPSPRISPEDEVSFNQTVQHLLTSLKNPKMKEFVVVLCRAHCLDSFFTEETWKLADSVTTVHPDSDKDFDLAKALEFPVNEKKKYSIDFIRFKAKAMNILVSIIQ